jgi:hypothetical protein
MWGSGAQTPAAPQRFSKLIVRDHPPLDDILETSFDSLDDIEMVHDIIQTAVVGQPA